MTVTTPHLTYEDLCQAREDGNRYELIDGVLERLSMPPTWHQAVVPRTTAAIGHSIGETGRGFPFPGPLDVRLSHHSVVQPDVTVVLPDRLRIIADALIDGVPNLLVEIASPSTWTMDHVVKPALYARSNVPEYWLVDADARAVTVHADPVDGTYRLVRRETSVVQSETVPGLKVDLSVVAVGLPGHLRVGGEGGDGVGP